MVNLYFRTTLNPALYHGFGKSAPFFEGWYYKSISEHEDQRLAIIPGVILGANGHAFIQILDGVSGQTSYHTFPLESFWASKDHFEIKIANNRFTQNQVSLDFQDEQGEVKGELEFEGVTPWPVNLLSPGIMGWYAWVPRMECYHGVLSFDHLIKGEVDILGRRYDLNLGRGYIEKDWGQSFPSAWVWFQTNHFAVSGLCLTASVAMIPWLGNAFRGFIIGFWHKGTLYRFATYTGAKIERLAIGRDSIDWSVSNKKFRLEMHAQQAPGGMLLGPTKVEMGKRVPETLNGTVSVVLRKSGGEIFFEGTGKYAGIEVNGDLTTLENLIS